VKVTGAGRTDTGVHATGQVVSFRTAAAFPFERLTLAANTELPPDLSVRDAGIAPADFSARFSALERTYIYVIFNRPQRSPLYARHAYHVWLPLDVEAMKEAAAPLIGEHDFRSFCGMLPESGPTLRTLRAIDIARNGDLIRIEIRGDGFLHRMARNIVGTLVECGTGKRDPASVAPALAALDRSAAGMTAPPQGLYLAGVRYADGFDSFAEPPVSAGW
jgi:tRNA pseudouridine38-40 synthase